MTKCDAQHGQGWPCLSDRCRSPVACGGFGYCRERNFRDAPSRVTNVLTFASATERFNSLPDLPYVAPDTDPA